MSSVDVRVIANSRDVLVNEINEKWAVLLKIYRCCDSLIIKAEEFDPNQSTYLQPMLEQRYCLGHLLHGKEAELAILDGENLEFDDYHKKYKDFTYVQASYDKAIGHCYRSFFDSADWFCVSIRERIIKLLAPFSTKEILAVFPKYYEEIRPDIDGICNNIADLRSQKDSAKNGNLMDEVLKYQEEVGRLFSIYAEIQKKIPSIHDFKKKSRVSNFRDLIIGGVGVAVVVKIIENVFFKAPAS